MSKHNPHVSVHQIIQHTIKAEQVLAGKTYEDFVSEWDTCLLVERLLEIIGEAANRLPEELRAQYPEIPWRQIIGTRHWLAHGYDAIDYRILWDAVTNHLAALRTSAERMLADLDRSASNN